MDFYSSELFFLDNDVTGVSLDIAHVNTPRHEHVTLLAPSSAPWIANNPVVGAVQGSIANDHHAVVDSVLKAVGARVDAGSLKPHRT